MGQAVQWMTLGVGVINLIALPFGLFKYVVRLETRLTRIETKIDIKD